ncbi:hypothetical protein [Chryseobacterium cheonjiense]|uniref:Uncharacterized protein n=1 Tax=Chryseobacterium cheonjiense TaxID=2728845 RepID=A0A7Y0A8V0_9FLAO|nr:hypothetical protein [Chryseobacterium cheonjiense]NML58845.1 hypothetical protein [Chryseobacterium cheonjiense]
MIRKLYNKLNTKWMYSVFIMFCGFILSFFILRVPSEIAFNTSIIIFFISILIPLLFGLIRVFKKDFLAGTLQILSSIIFGGSGFLCLSIFLMLYPYDFFADNLEIPKNIQFEKPINLNDNLASGPNKITDKKETFFLYDGFQPGIYQYEIFLNKIEKGTVYLKIYEITKNQILSETDVANNSKMQVYNSTNELKRYQLKDDFTVYEGNWGEFYGSKIEIWFQPDDKKQKERKLMSKNYIIQGWQR